MYVENSNPMTAHVSQNRGSAIKMVHTLTAVGNAEMQRVPGHIFWGDARTFNLCLKVTDYWGEDQKWPGLLTFQDFNSSSHTWSLSSWLQLKQLFPDYGDPPKPQPSPIGWRKYFIFSVWLSWEQNLQSLLLKVSRLGEAGSLFARHPVMLRVIASE